MCGKFMYQLEPSKSKKASVVCEGCLKAEEQIFNLEKVGISHLSYFFLELPKIFFFLHCQYFVSLDEITPFCLPPPTPKEKNKVKIFLRLQKSHLQT